MTDLPDKINKLRVFPRLFSMFYLYWMGEVYDWYMMLPDPSDMQAGFAGAVGLAGAAYFKFYVESGPKNDK